MNTAGYHVAGIARASLVNRSPRYEARVYWMQHEKDDRHIVIDQELRKIVKRFGNRETSWMDAERWANDYANKVHAE